MKCNSMLVGVVAMTFLFSPFKAFAPIISLRKSSVESSKMFYSRCLPLRAQPKRGGLVDSYQTVSINCAKCGEKLFRYKKKNGTKSNLVKCYIERISEDYTGLLKAQEISGISSEEFQWSCPNCETKFARHALIHGRPALKMVGGKIRMTKK